MGHIQLGFHSEVEEGTGQGGRAGPSLQVEPWRPDCPAVERAKHWLAPLSLPEPSREAALPLEAVWFPHTTFHGISRSSLRRGPSSERQEGPGRRFREPLV